MRRRKALRQERGAKIHAGKIRAGQIRLTQNGHAHIRTGKFCAVHIGKAQIHVSQLGAPEIHIRKITAKEFHSAGLRFAQVGPRKNRFRHVRVAKIGFAQVRAGEVSAGEFCMAQVRARQVDVAQDGPAQICSAQVGVGKVRAGQVGSRPAVFATEEEFVRFQNIRERAPVVLDASWFSEGHAPSAIDGSRLLYYWIWRSRGTALLQLFGRNRGSRRRRAVPSRSVECDSVRPVILGCPDGSCGVKVYAKFFSVLLIFPVVLPARPAASLVFQHVTVIDGTGRAALADQTVVVVGGRITALGPAGQIKIEKSARVIDGRGKFLIPGLWDMHVHIAGGHTDPSWSKDVLLPLLLASGITGVRDMGGDLQALLSWKRDIESGALLGPHLVASGPWLARGGQKSAEQFPVANAEEARAAVRELKKRGADFIKIISLPSREAFFAVADEAGKQSIPFAGHLPFEIGAAEASNAGMRSIEHFFYSALALSFSSQEDELRKRLVEAESKGDAETWEKITHEADATFSTEKAAALFRTLSKNGTWITPTIASLYITSHPDSWKLDDANLDFVPLAVAKQWRASSNDARTKRRAAWLARQSANDLKLTGELHRAGVPLLVGSDSVDPFVFPGESLHRELEEFVQAGLTPLEAIQDATLGAAQFLGREKVLGTVEAGKTADLVLLGANPLENISNTRKILAVIRNGQYLDRDALDRTLAQAKSAAAAVPAEK